jgi:hypothetical protein
LAATAARWGDVTHTQSWVEALERLGATCDQHYGLVAWLRLRAVPPLLLIYAAGLVGAAHKDFPLVKAMLEQPAVYLNGRKTNLSDIVNPLNINQDGFFAHLPEYNSYVAISLWLQAALRPTLTSFFSSDTAYTVTFDYFEYLLSLRHVTLRGRNRTYLGAYQYNRHRRHESDDPVKVAGHELEREGQSWPPFASGMLGSDIGTLRSAKSEIDRYLEEIGW